MNTIRTADGAEVYEHDIPYFADEYIAQELGVVDRRDKESKQTIRESFPDLLMYISDRIPKPDNGSIELLDHIFNVYVHLCTRYGVLPTLEMFGVLLKTDSNTFSAWGNGEYRSLTHSLTVKRWKQTCKSFVIDRLHNQTGTNANLIFTAKAAYGMRETAPITPEPTGFVTPILSPEEIAREHGFLEELPEVEPEKPEI